MIRRFKDRPDAGQRLAQLLIHYAGRADVVVLGLARGGIPVAFEVAERLGAPLDVAVVRKLGVPINEELAMGAIAPAGVRVISERVVDDFGLTDAVIERVEARERRQLERRERTSRGDRPALDGRGKTGIVIDEGLATGATMRAAVLALRIQGAARIVVADEIICAVVPTRFAAVSQLYEDVSETTDKEVRDLLRRPAGHRPRAA